MEKVIKLIRIPLIICGFDIFEKSNRIRNAFFRLLYHFFLIHAFICMVLTIFQKEKNVDFSDKIFLLICLSSIITGFLQFLYFFQHHDIITTIFDDVQIIYETREEKWLQKQSKTIFEECSKRLYKLSK